MLKYAVLHVVHLFYTGVVLEVLRHFCLFIPNWQRIRLGWWAVFIGELVILYPMLYLRHTTRLVGVSLVVTVVNFIFLLSGLLCVAHVEHIIVGCIRKPNGHSNEENAVAILKRLKVCMCGSLAASITATCVYAFWSLFGERKWFPVVLFYLCGLLSFPFRAVYVFFQMRFQTLIATMLAAQSSKVVLKSFAHSQKDDKGNNIRNDTIMESRENDERALSIGDVSRQQGM
jgi:hypothetical protein